MFIHIGNNHVIQSNNIIAIIDRNMITSSTITEQMMAAAEQEGKVVGPVIDAKSVVLATDFIYYSSLSVVTLKKRASMISTISKLDDYTEEIE